MLVYNTTFTNCDSTSGEDGAPHAYILTDSKLTIGNYWKFINCRCEYYGGALLSHINDSNS